MGMELKDMELERKKHNVPAREVKSRRQLEIELLIKQRRQLKKERWKSSEMGRRELTYSRRTSKLDRTFKGGAEKERMDKDLFF